jgi:hypothetical protein
LLARFSHPAQQPSQSILRPIFLLQHVLVRHARPSARPMHGRVVLPLTAKRRKVCACPPPWPHLLTVPRCYTPPARAGALCPSCLSATILACTPTTARALTARARATCHPHSLSLPCAPHALVCLRLPPSRAPPAQSTSPLSCR